MEEGLCGFFLLYSSVPYKFESESESEKRTAYVDQMCLIVADSFNPSAQNPTDAEKVHRAETWARVLYGIIPERHLAECFDRAFQNHKGNFPVSAYDLKTAWSEIKSEFRQTQIAERRYLPEIAESECERCYGSGMEVVAGQGARRCATCSVTPNAPDSDFAM